MRSTFNWETDQSPDDVEDFDIKRSPIVTDIVFGKLQFLWWTTSEDWVIEEGLFGCIKDFYYVFSSWYFPADK